ncbi:MAG TPA: dTDP-4-dehydrorhamnose 3,5-epimerase [Dinghuibacter sp.]|jgi:dTDP-4-dehydrorhamnose 3,5-epimerase|uniref:dTDP-4-dehydrorhamnose 3,5-epimerase n=1 Tax=Dinghuibacter sp. TaxID=2024697 RepID=UPI002B96D23D|nr:dTDP-4-dehydrorhamnose 3,5-epimerase [Dinghuibacter sp.]HTJ14547.1 dTDP-4-dehydrorhamnose 3,5-epimerase [Dinghuibacter sp.]
MGFQETGIEGLVVYEPRVFHDDRGYFFESYNDRAFKEAGFSRPWVQDNQARSSYGVIRGLHFQHEPHAQTKLIRALEGSILDVVVDIRRGSPTYGKVFAIELSAANKRQLLVPQGFAHGYSVLSETAEILYKCDNFYNKAAEGGIRYDDPSLNIDWRVPMATAVISPKDVELPTLAELV